MTTEESEEQLDDLDALMEQKFKPQEKTNQNDYSQISSYGQVNFKQFLQPGVRKDDDQSVDMIATDMTMGD